MSLNPTNANTGTKTHLRGYKGIRLNKKGNLVARKIEGVPQTSCRMFKDSEELIRFNEIRKSHPGEVCKKCLARYKELMEEAKNFKG